jgi:hypothetical protein
MQLKIDCSEASQSQRPDRATGVGRLVLGAHKG